MSDQQISTSTAGRKAKLHFFDLPQEVRNKVFEMAFDEAPLCDYTSYHWYIQPDQHSPVTNNLTLVFRVRSNLVVSTDYLESAARAYGRFQSIDVVVMLTHGVSRLKGLKVVRHHSKEATALKELLNSVCRLTINEGCYTDANLNLDFIRQICPNVNDIKVYTDAEKPLLWELCYDGTQRVKVFHLEEYRCPPSPTPYILNTEQVAAFQNNKRVGRTFDIVHDCLFVSRPREDGIGLSCTTGTWSESKSLSFKLLCCFDKKWAEAEVELDLKTDAPRYWYSQVVDSALLQGTSTRRVGLPIPR